MPVTNDTKPAKAFLPKMWIICHESLGKVENYKQALKDLSKENPLLAFQRNNGLIGVAHIDTLPGMVIRAAKVGQGSFHIIRCDNLAHLVAGADPVSLAQAARKEGRANLEITQSNVASLDEGLSELRPDESVLAALKSGGKVKLRNSQLLENYLEALSKWATASYQKNPKELKRQYRNLYDVVAHNPNAAELVAEEILLIISDPRERAPATSRADALQRTAPMPAQRPVGR